MLLNNFKFEYILIMHAVVKLSAHLVEMYICKREYPNVKLCQKEKSYEFKKHIGALIFHKINGLVGSNIDSIIISSFLGLKYVAIYSTYSYIITMMKNILGKLSTSMTAIIGNYMAKSKENAYEIFKEFNSMLFYIAIVICTSLTLAIDGFIEIFYEGEIQTDFLIAVSFVAILFTFIIKMSTTLFVSAGGLYKETKHCAMTDTAVNLVLSLTLIHIIGISGVLVATAVAVFIAEYILKTRVIHKYIFKVSPMDHFIKNIKFFIIYIIDLIIGYNIINLFNINDIFSWFIIFVIFTLINAAIILFVFYIFKEITFINRFKVLFERKRKNEKSLNIAK